MTLDDLNIFGEYRSSCSDDFWFSVFLVLYLCFVYKSPEWITRCDLVHEENKGGIHAQIHVTNKSITTELVIILNSNVNIKFENSS